MPVVVIPLGVLLAGLVLLALAMTAKTWAEAMLRVMAAGTPGGILRIITLPVRLIERVVVPGLNFIEHEISKSASHYMHPLARWFNGLGHFAVANAVSAGLFAESVAVGFERTTTIVLPREIGRRTRPISRKAQAALGLAGATAAALARYRHGIDRLLREKVLPQVRRLERATTVTLPRELGRIRARARALERELRHPSAAALRRLAARLWVLGIAGLLVRTLARRFPWLFCRRVKKVGGRLCGIDDDLINALLFETLLLGGTLNIEVLARQCQGLAKLGEAGLRELIDELD